MLVNRRQFLVGSAASVGLALVPQAVLAGPAGAVARPLVHGVVATNFDAMLAFEQAAGRFVRSYTYFRSLGAPGLNPRWERDFATRLVARGTTPVLTLQMQDPRFGVGQPAFAHARIVAGDHDAALAAFATNLAAVPGAIVVRLMHEGNGDWYPWCAGVNGNTASSYIAAWRHIVGLFRGLGVTNVRWLWSMNKAYTGGGTPLPSVYPGDEYVDQVGLSGYNGGTALDRGGWRSFDTIFGASFDEVRAITTKPRFVTETGCVEQGGDKAAWILDMWRWLETHPDIAGVTWFDMVKAVDWRVATSATAQQAYRRGVIATVSPR